MIWHLRFSNSVIFLFLSTFVRIIRKFNVFFSSIHSSRSLAKSTIQLMNMVVNRLVYVRLMETPKFASNNNKQNQSEKHADLICRNIIDHYRNNMFIHINTSNHRLYELESTDNCRSLSYSMHIHLFL